MNPPPPTPTPIPADGTITLQPDVTHQSFEGFGASGAWWAQDVGGWEDEKRNRIIELLFNPETGIGLSIYRYNIGGGENSRIRDPWRQAETFEVAEGEYDWGRDANAIWVMKAAQAAGVEHFVAFVNSPPGRMTLSGVTNADFSVDPTTNVAPEMYDQFAQYLVDVVTHLQETEGVPIGWLSPINEPQWDWQVASGQEGTHYTPTEAAAVTRAVIEAVNASGLDVKISVFEGGEWSKSSRDYVGPFLSDPLIRDNVDHIAIHSYWSTPEDKAQFVAYLDANYADIPIEMTEWTEMRSGRDETIDSALILANTIHDDLTIGSVISWQYWIAVSKYDFRDGLIYVDVDSRDIIETKRLWAMGNYSRFIRPGATRIGVESSHEDLKVSAFQSGSQTVLVAINNNRSDLTLELNGWPEEATIEAYVTSSESNLEPVDPNLENGLMVFPAESITTIVIEE